MREDVCGLFWDDTPPPRSTKPPKPKREPPPRTWEEPGYLPYLEEAQRLPVDLFTTEELAAALANREPLIFDSEVYTNYYLAAFTSLKTGKVIYFEMEQGEFLDVARLRWIVENFTIIGFNSEYFDLPILALALDGYDCNRLKISADKLIVEGLKPWLLLRSAKVAPLKIDHVDIISVCPLQASLKIYSGRVHTPRMQELPFKPDTILTKEQIDVVRWYCIASDLTGTAFVFMEIQNQVALRASMSSMYGVDLRSKSDAQIAEAVIVHELTRVNYGVRPKRPEIPPGTKFNYFIPDFIKFETPILREVLGIVGRSVFVIKESGAPELPPAIGALKIEIGKGVYQMGIGGLHSTETKTAMYADSENLLIDRDVTSYYPSIILTLGLFPKHLGTGFLEVYKSLVTRRVEAKKAGNKVEADTLKIVVNGSFGKLGSKWSVLYSPDLMLQVTITGQLALLMLIERFELAGIEIGSANTDGIIIKCPKARVIEMNQIVSQWESDTGFNTEETSYQAVFSRDVNNYIAIKEDRGFKVKGDYAERGSAGDSILSKNPVNLICRDAVTSFLTEGIPISETIRNCKDITRFISVRTVKGGAVKDGEYLGKAIRWYQSSEVEGEIIYAKNGNKVPNSEKCRPLMELPPKLPQDIDFQRYEAEALGILRDIGYPMPEE